MSLQKKHVSREVTTMGLRGRSCANPGKNQNRNRPQNLIGSVFAPKATQKKPSTFQSLSTQFLLSFEKNAKISNLKFSFKLPPFLPLPENYI